MAGERKGATPTHHTIKQSLNPSEVRAEPAASNKLPTLKLGRDVHADSIVVVCRLDDFAPPPAQQFTPAKFLDWVMTRLRLAGMVSGCYEAGHFGCGLHRDQVALGIHTLVVQPVWLDEDHNGVKHDKSDAKQLALMPLTAPGKRFEPRIAPERDKQRPLIRKKRQTLRQP